ncbi:MAG: PPK2 family polyphosphate kinase [Nitrososphaera sp.]
MLGNEGISIADFLIEHGQKVRLDKTDPDGTKAIKKQAVLAETEKLVEKLSGLQELLYAGQEQKVLIVLQAMDTGGKDGTIKHVFQGVNPQGVKVVNFRQPSQTELQHDYLWRVHQNVPASGEIVIFNRSHYESVTVVRVHRQISDEEASRRFKQINKFERYLTEEGMTILKFYLHIDSAEQKKRLIQRLNDPTKQWKFNINDLTERKLWTKYMEAYEQAIENTSTDYAPWYIVPANHNFLRNYIVSKVIVKSLEKLGLRYPKLKQDVNPADIQ